MVFLKIKREVLMVKPVHVKTGSLENFFDDKNRKTVEKAVKTIEKSMHDAILTAMDNLVSPRVEMALSSLAHGTTSTDRNPDRKDFMGNTEDTPLGSASNQLDLNVDQ